MPAFLPVRKIIFQQHEQQDEKYRYGSYIRYIHAENADGKHEQIQRLKKMIAEIIFIGPVGQEFSLFYGKESIREYNGGNKVKDRQYKEFGAIAVMNAESGPQYGSDENAELPDHMENKAF